MMSLAKAQGKFNHMTRATWLWMLLAYGTPLVAGCYNDMGGMPNLEHRATSTALHWATLCCRFCGGHWYW